MKSIFVLFPHQLFEVTGPLRACQEVWLVEEFLFFKQYKFHKLKLALHRASMQHHAAQLRARGHRVHYVEATDALSDIRLLVPRWAADGITAVHHFDVCDQWLHQRLHRGCGRAGIAVSELPSPGFINTRADLDTYFGQRERYFQTDFYIQQRKKLNLLIEPNGQPTGGRWSFDADNRKPWPRDKMPPRVDFPPQDAYYTEAVEYVDRHFPDHPGHFNGAVRYPHTHTLAAAWLDTFLHQRLADFGPYEDAILSHQSWLSHSVLTPMLNIGLLTPDQVVDAAMLHARTHHTPIASLEGFLRQIIGWREFIRGVYVHSGSRARTTNHWQMHRPVPPSMYTGTTGIAPVDTTIRKLIDTAYNHHIERLMVLGNFMLLNEMAPDSVYTWFMEMYIDAYDWVMVPNVYGMSQFADGGLMATKPYISGSSYVRKMSDYAAGNWCGVWDALFWTFMHRHRGFFSSNPRLGMLLGTYDRFTPEKQADLHRIATTWEHGFFGG